MVIVHSHFITTEGILSIAMKSDFEKILGLVNKLSEINTTGVEPLIYLSDEENMLRIDEIDETIFSKLEKLRNSF